MHIQILHHFVKFHFLFEIAFSVNFLDTIEMTAPQQKKEISDPSWVVLVVCLDPIAFPVGSIPKTNNLPFL